MSELALAARAILDGAGAGSSPRMEAMSRFQSTQLSSSGFEWIALGPSQRAPHGPHEVAKSRDRCMSRSPGGLAVREGHYFRAASALRFSRSSMRCKDENRT